MRRGESFRERWRGSNKSFTSSTRPGEVEEPEDPQDTLKRNSSLRRSVSRKLRRYVR